MPDRIMTATPPAAGVVLVLLALLAPGAAPPARGADTGPATRPAAAAAPTPIHLPSYGVSVPEPQGFARDTDAQNTVAVLIPSGGPPETPRQLLWLDVFAKQDGSLADFVRQLGEDGGMEPGRKDLKWGDRPAVELVSKRVPGEKLTAIRQLATERDGYLFRLQYAVTNKADPARTEPYEQFVRETRWLPIATAGQGVARRTPAFPLSNGMIVNIPDPFRPDMKSPSKIVRAFQAQDLATGRHENPTGNPRWFTTAYFHRADELAAEAAEAGLDVRQTVGVEGMAHWLRHLAARWDDAGDREVILQAVRATETEPTLAGMSSHFITVAARVP